MPHPANLGLACPSAHSINPKDGSEVLLRGQFGDLKNDLAKVLRTLTQCEIATTRFAERQEVLIAKVAEVLDMHFVAFHGEQSYASGRSCVSDSSADHGFSLARPQPDNNLTQGAPIAKSECGVEVRVVAVPGSEEQVLEEHEPDPFIDDVDDLEPKKSGIRQMVDEFNAKRRASFERKKTKEAGSFEVEQKADPLWVKFVKSPACDAFTGAVVCAHMLIMFAQLQWRSYDLWENLNSGEKVQDLKLFGILEKCFNAVYLLELLLRLSVFGKRHFTSSPVVNGLDTFVVIACCIATFILEPMDLNLGGGMLPLARTIRVARIFRILRTLRIFRFLKFFKELRIIISSLHAAFSRTLLWSSVIIGFTILVVSLMMCTLAMMYIEDEKLPLSERKWLFDFYGSAAKAMFQIFEATFAGRWGITAEHLIFHFSPWFSIFWVIYIFSVNFAMLRVITAIFLKQTMDQANVEEEKRIMQKMKEKEKISNELRKIYVLGDEDGDGMINETEFVRMMENPEVLEILDKLEMGEEEMLALFSILSNDDGTVDFEEFLTASLKLKSSAQVVDVIQILHAQMVSLRRCDQIAEMLQSVLPKLQRTSVSSQSKSFHAQLMAKGQSTSSSSQRTKQAAAAQ